MADKVDGKTRGATHRRILKILPLRVDKHAPEAPAPVVAWENLLVTSSGAAFPATSWMPIPAAPASEEGA